MTSTLVPSPHSPAQPDIVERYGRAEYVSAVGARRADGVDVDDIFGIFDDGQQQVSHARQGWGVQPQLEHGFLDPIPPGFQDFGYAQTPLVVGDIVGDDIDHRHAIPRH